MRAIALSIALLISSIFATAQIYNPLEWETSVVDNKDGTFDLKIKATIDKGWHLYAQDLPRDDGPIATEFTFPKEKTYERIGKVVEPKPITEFDPNFEMDLNFYAKEVVFTQKIKSKTRNAFSITAEVYYMVCDAEKCLPPEFVDLEFEIPASETALSENAEETKKASEENSEAVDQGSVKESDIIEDAVVWTFRSEKVGDNSYKLFFDAILEEGWNLYSQHLPSDEGPIATAFYFNSEEGHTFEGEVEELGELITGYDPNFEMDLNFFAKRAGFMQKVTTDADQLSGELEFMVCNDKMCLPPELIEFVFDLKSGEGNNALEKTDEKANIDIESIIPELPNMDLDNPVSNCGKQKQETSDVWMVFLFGLIGGLIALLTPCVFPMIPLTVSFFTKGDGESKGVGKAFLYGFFIFLIYALLSIPFHFNTDPEVLNEIATSVWLNITFFVIFIVFAISFFGYFEITLPSAITNKTDSASQVGGVIGIFFMALTLAMVSFSCTGPILGTVLGGALKNGPWPITAAMSGFGIALGLPFALFAMFPSVMNKLPQSGGWLNSVKVVLGFIELALAIKFLSNADLVEQWGFLHRETFFGIWAIIGFGLFAYLMGWIKFPHDSPIKKMSSFRIGFAALVLAFSIYIAPGVLKNPPWTHNLLSGFPPPTFYSWYEKDALEAEFTDFNLALAEAKMQNKPLLIDFTGWACVNCRKMEESVWTVDEIKQKLEEKFILVSLYVDDKVELPEDQQGIFEYEAGGKIRKKKIKTIGNKWATFQTQKFNNNSQPFYVMLSPNGELLGTPVGYTPNAKEYEKFLDCGLNAFDEINK